MPANVTRLSYAKFTKRDVPWWGTGTSSAEHAVEGRFLTIDEGRDNFPWHVDLQPAYQKRGGNVLMEVPNTKLVTLIHDDIHNPDHLSILGTVGKLYEPYQPWEMLDFAAELVDEHGFFLDTVGDLKGHKTIFASMRINDLGVTAQGVAEEVDWWLVLCNSYDGQTCLRGDITPIRPVCTNTLRYGQQTAKATWKVRHVGDLSSRAMEARRALGLITAYEKEFNDNAERMAETAFELEQFHALTEDLFPTDDKQGDRTKVWNSDKKAGLTTNFLHSTTIDEGWRFTQWGALQAVTEWAEWINEEREDRRTPAKERRMLSTLMGGATEQIRERAYSGIMARTVR